MAQYLTECFVDLRCLSLASQPLAKLRLDHAKCARLPDGQPVKIEAVHSDGFASVRRVEGEMAGEIAVCKVSSLLTTEENSCKKPCDALYTRAL